MVASIKGHLPVVKQLVSKGADIAAIENVSFQWNNIILVLMNLFLEWKILVALPRSAKKQSSA